MPLVAHILIDPSRSVLPAYVRKVALESSAQAVAEEPSVRPAAAAAGNSASAAGRAEFAQASAAVRDMLSWRNRPGRPGQEAEGEPPTWRARRRGLLPMRCWPMGTRMQLPARRAPGNLLCHRSPGPGDLLVPVPRSRVHAVQLKRRLRRVPCLSRSSAT